jgi:hypothetical protein
VGGGDGCAKRCSLYACLVYSSRRHYPKAPVACVDYHVVITSIILASSVLGQPEENVKMWECGENSFTAMFRVAAV